MSVYPRLHRILAIPGNYHIECPRDGVPKAPAPRIDGLAREDAIRTLRIAGELQGEDDTEALLDAICRKLTKIKGEPSEKELAEGARQARRPRLPKVPTHWAEKEAARLARRDAIMAAIVANPSAKTSHLAKRFKADVTTVRDYRRQLRNAGKIA